MHCRLFSSVPGFYPVAPFPQRDNKKMFPDTSRNAMRVTKSPLSENHWLKCSEGRSFVTLFNYFLISTFVFFITGLSLYILLYIIN